MDVKQKLCVFCGKDESFGPMDVEHFVPKALWDNKRPDGTKTVPAHVACNKQFCQDNDDFRDFLAMDAASTKQPEVQKLLKGKLKRKIEKRGDSIKRRLKPVVLPNISQTGMYLGNAVFMAIDPQMIVRVLRNVARGLYFSVTGNLVPIDCEIRVIYLDDSNYIQLIGTVQSLCKTQSFGDDVFRYKHDFTEPGTMACIVQFYRTREFLCYALWDVPEE